MSLNEEEIRQDIIFSDNNMEIRSISRLKYRDKNTMELKSSLTIKVEFVSNLLPEFMYIWSVRVRVKPYVNRVHRCFNCFDGTTRRSSVKAKSHALDVERTTMLICVIRRISVVSIAVDYIIHLINLVLFFTSTSL